MTPDQVAAALLISLFGVFTVAIIGIQGLKQTLQQMGDSGGDYRPVFRNRQNLF